MLRQILNDMYVDPEILSGLDEYQKQTLFCKMREEQIRRWRIREQQNDRLIISKKSINPPSGKKKKNVSFREDNEGEPWVNVIEPAITTECSDSDDNDINQNDTISNETKQRARELAEIETKEIRRQYKAELCEIITDLGNEKDDPSDGCKKNGLTNAADAQIYCSVDDLREKSKGKCEFSQAPNGGGVGSDGDVRFKPSNAPIINFKLTETQNEKNAVLKEISNTKSSQKVSAKIALWEQRVIGEKTTEIYLRMKRKQKKAAEEEAKKQEEAWKAQERKAKEADMQYREIARRAREEHRRSLTIDPAATGKSGSVNGAPTAPANGPQSLESIIPRPQSHEAMIKWYSAVEVGKCSGLESGATRSPCKWFHGLLTRAEAEQQLENESTGTFLVRLSEKIWGYAISYKDVDKCKHYLISATNGQYKFLGANQISHDSLSKPDLSPRRTIC